MLITYPLLFLLVDFVSQDFKAKLSDFGLAKDGPEDDETHVSTRVMGTQGYAAPEYIMTGTYKQLAHHISYATKKLSGDDDY